MRLPPDATIKGHKGFQFLLNWLFFALLEIVTFFPFLLSPTEEARRRPWLLLSEEHVPRLGRRRRHNSANFLHAYLLFVLMRECS